MTEPYCLPHSGLDVIAIWRRAWSLGACLRSIEFSLQH